MPGVDAQPLPSGFAVLVTTPVAPVTSLWQPALILLALIVLAMLCIVFVVETDLRRPLRRLERAVAGMAREEYDTPVPRPAGGEIGRLASSFEEMRRQLRATIAGTQRTGRHRQRARLATTPGDRAARGRRPAADGRPTADTAFILVGGGEMTDSFAVTDGGTPSRSTSTRALQRVRVRSGPRIATPAPRRWMVGAAPESIEAHTGNREFCGGAVARGPHRSRGARRGARQRRLQQR